MLSVGNVLDGELVPLVSTEADQPKIREDVPIPRRQQPAPAPQQTLPRERNFHRQLSGKIHLRHLLRLGELDCLLMRKDPPFDTEYIYTTYVLERAREQGALVVNHPQGLRDMNEKVYTAWFPQCCAPTLITRSMPGMEAFLREHGRIVCKPLHGMGGRSIFVLERHDKNMNVVFETLTDYGQRFAIAQKYIPDIVETGDSRVLLIDGEPVPHALARMPVATDHRGNLAAGAKGVGRPLNDRDRWLAAQIGPTLAARGMLFVGLDVIGGFVTEINVTSPTGIRELDRQFGTDIGDLLMQAIQRRLQAAGRATGVPADRGVRG